jgi:bla regulator protein blaR1
MTDFIVNHLWQSTCFVALAGLLAYALRGNSARVRYWVWLGASLKFLVPLALLMSLGSLIHLPVQRAAAVPAADFPRTFVQLAEPFVPDAYSAAPARPSMPWAALAISVFTGSDPTPLAAGTRLGPL